METTSRQGDIEYTSRRPGALEAFAIAAGAGVSIAAIIVAWRLQDVFRMYPGLTMVMLLLIVVTVLVIGLVSAIGRATTKQTEALVRGIVGVLDADARGDAAVATVALALGVQPQGMTGKLGDGLDIERRAAEIEHKKSQARLNDRRETWPEMPPPVAGAHRNGHSNGNGRAGGAGDDDVEVM